MIVVRFKVQCRPDRLAEALAAFREVIAPSRTVQGVISFDIGQDLADPTSLIATEVFEDREALDRQESLPQVKTVLDMLDDVLVGEPEATIFHVSQSEPYGG